MKHITSVAVLSFFLALSVNATAQSAKYKQTSEDRLKPDLTFSPDIKTYGCTLIIDKKLIHISDIAYTELKNIEPHDVRGKLLIHLNNKNAPLISEKTVNDQSLFKKHFIPLLNECKISMNETKKIQNNSKYGKNDV